MAAATRKGGWTPRLQPWLAALLVVPLAAVAIGSVAHAQLAVIPPAPPAQIVFTTQPSTTTVGETIQPAVAVQLLDRSGNRTTNHDMVVALTLRAQDGSRATLDGTTSVLTVGGIAQFGDLSVGRLGTRYRLIASADSLQPATSNPFDVVAVAAVQLSFTAQPGGTADAGAVLPQQPEVSLTDANGNVVDSDAVVTLAITSGTAPSNARLSCDSGVSRQASHGVARFSGCRIDTAANDVRLTATAGGVSDATSDAFTVDGPPPSPPESGPPWVLVGSASAGAVGLLALVVVASLVTRLRHTRRGRRSRIHVEPRAAAGSVSISPQPAGARHRVLLVPRPGAPRMVKKR